ncbi:MAG: winged helix-turn-helix transcriptional regulator [Acidimicrobiales bacterium]
MVGDEVRAGATCPAPHESVVDPSLRRAFALLGKRWNGVLLAALAGGPATFAALHREIGAISDSVLCDRLRELTDAGLVERRVEPGPPVAVRYALSGAGAALFPALDALAAWARDHLPAGSDVAPS